MIQLLSKCSSFFSISILTHADPWKKHKHRRRHHNTRRHKPSVVDFTEYDMNMTTRSDVFSNSYDDSGFGTDEFHRARIPSVLDSFDSYRAARRLISDSSASPTHNCHSNTQHTDHNTSPINSYPNTKNNDYVVLPCHNHSNSKHNS